ncbi:hypothetical protein ACIBU0_13705 [Streptomyces sp. NPDC049627]|uniref:hypothetical protein n=1 Tax=Streptomyces sp. NPDC049627 TaxID=3365595 RepID=UPI0037967680
MTAGWCSRASRAAVFAAVCVALAAVAHVMMSGSHVPAGTLVGGAATTGVVGWCLAGRERGPALIVSVVVALQTALHLAFSLVPQEAVGQAQASTGMGSMSHTMPPMHMDSTDLGHLSLRHLDHGGHVTGGTSSAGMVAAHLLAALLCGLWLAYGERAAFRILRAVAGWLATPLGLPLDLPAPPHRPRIRVRRRHDDRSPRRLLLTHSITSRGPPLATTVA